LFFLLNGDGGKEQKVELCEGEIQGLLSVRRRSETDRCETEEK
jgi:hypothetical protein